MRRVAIPSDNGILTEFCRSDNNFEVYLSDERHILGKEDLSIPFTNRTTIPEWASKNGITDLIVNRIDNEIIKYFAGLKINLFVGIPIEKTRNLMMDFLNGNLKSDKKIIEEISE